MQLPRFHRLCSAYYPLEGQVCEACGEKQFPTRSSCRSCHSRDLAVRRFSGRGRVFSYSQAAQAPEGFEPPHLMALVELEEGPVIAAQLTDLEPEKIEIGMDVEMVTRRIRAFSSKGYLVYGYKFRPPLGAAEESES